MIVYEIQRFFDDSVFCICVEIAIGISTILDQGLWCIFIKSESFINEIQWFSIILVLYICGYQGNDTDKYYNIGPIYIEIP